MGQYYYVVNLNKRQFLHPHKFGDGLKLMEFGCSADGAMTGLAVLLADGNNRGGGDLHTENPIIGSWAGDRIVIAGDYADTGRFLTDTKDEGIIAALAEARLNGEQLERMNLHDFASNHFEDISPKVIEAMAEDGYTKKELIKRKVVTPDGKWRDPSK